MSASPVGIDFSDRLVILTIKRGSRDRGSISIGRGSSFFTGKK
jgi:hypothetical protein